MSDLSDLSVSSDEDRYDYHDGTDSDESEDDIPEESDGGEDEENPPAPGADLANLTLCLKHKAGEMVTSCTSCAAALALIGDKSKVRQLTKDGQKDSLVNKFKGRCDDIVPTMNLSDSIVEVASQVFAKGQFRDKRVWADIVKNYLTLAPEVHESLSVDIKLEDYVEKLKSDKRFQNVFKFRQEFTDCIKNLRISQRPVFRLAETIHDNISLIRDIGVST